ncbi:MAG: serine/threonine protein kinase [Planctomycetaceae bacterium]|nr:serine/threonine protein kinase [Planctomycetaceae bacterium]
MQITCPKCQKPIELMETISYREEEGPNERTHIAEGVFCPACGLIPFDYLKSGSEQVRITSDQGMVAHFQLIRPLGKGGFGIVWLAKDITLDRLVALKMPVAHKTSVSDLLYEAQSAAKLRHPNIVSIFETGQTDSGQPFIASDYIDGLNLKDVLSAGRPTLETTLTLMVTISDALQHAHQMGIVHRDVKPANIMIDQDGVPYVADFGLAMRVSEESGSSSGPVVGTAHYMSPEQAMGQIEKTDHRTDIYAVGVMLFQMLTGELPYRGNNQAVIYQKVKQDAPSPRLLRPSVPKDLETICLRCLERDPEKRYSSAKLLKEEFQRVQRGEPILARPVGLIEKGFRWSKRYPLVAGLSLGLLLSLLGGLIGVTFFWLHAVENARVANETVYRSQMSLVAQRYVQGDLEGIRWTLDRIST